MNLTVELIERLHKADDQHFPCMGPRMESVRFQSSKGCFVHLSNLSVWQLGGWAWDQLPKGTIMAWSSNGPDEWRCRVHVRTPEGWDIGTYGCHGYHEHAPIAILLAYCEWKETLLAEMV